MGGDRRYTRAELRQHEQDQQDPRWLAWLAEMDDQIDRFRTETVPGLSAGPWDAEDLRSVERALLERFPDVDDAEGPEHQETVDQFARFIGEVFRRNFEGHWYNNTDADDQRRGFGPSLREGYNPAYLEPVRLVFAALDRGTGSEWARVFGFSQKRYAEWAATGRPQPQY
ncbi:hypothetical protein ACQPW1_27780 [Nocardia sp. CA-128927]|uniref:hypothetical protein n=1 Tax=Nocardia sp. CA-128927 TaxID=3239975 RepID=UPI003D98608D